jgi:hypothetical protein
LVVVVEHTVTPVVVEVVADIPVVLAVTIMERMDQVVVVVPSTEEQAQ